MGNAPSNEKGNRPFGNILKSNNLGLSKQELDERCKPSGLYPKCSWEDKAIRRLIGDGKLAARRKGKEISDTYLDRECPICFLNYQDINITKCCQASICTECYLQVKPAKPQAHCTCPFCNAPKLHVSVAPPVERNPELDKNKIAASTTTTNAGTQSRPEAAPKDGMTSTTILSTPPPSVPPTTGFGSSLEQNDYVARMRLRTSSFDHTAQNLQKNQPIGEQEISNLAMTPDERRQLEQEVRAQHHHPLTMRLEQEEAERRLRNEVAYQQRQSGTNSFNHSNNSRSSAAGAGHPPRLDWNRIVDAYETGGGRRGHVQSLDDLVVLEAAILLSMEEEARRRGEPPPSPAAVRQQYQAAAERYASANFPLAHARASNPFFPIQPGRGSAVGGLDHPFMMLSTSSGANASSPLGRLGAGRPTSILLSEEEQIAMAIAASLREPSTSGSPNNDDGDGENNTTNEAQDVAGAIETNTNASNNIPSTAVPSTTITTIYENNNENQVNDKTNSNVDSGNVDGERSDKRNQREENEIHRNTTGTTSGETMIERTTDSGSSSQHSSTEGAHI